MKVKYGITGNKYVLGTKEECIEVCNHIGKSTNSIRFSEKYNCFVFRIKSKYHKLRLKNYLDK